LREKSGFSDNTSFTDYIKNALDRSKGKDSSGVTVSGFLEARSKRWSNKNVSGTD